MHEFGTGGGVASLMQLVATFSAEILKEDSIEHAVKPADTGTMLQRSPSLGGAVNSSKRDLVSF